jgi:charged multivesicular body protein 4
MLEKRERYIEKQASQCREEAKAKLRAKDKRGALFLVKRAKLYEQQIHQLYGKRSNLDIQIMALEGAAGNAEIFKVMSQGRQALKAATAAVDVDHVSDVMEDINESIQMNEEINDALSQQIGPQMDEDELNAELEEMEQEMTDKDLLTVNDLPQPAVAAVNKQRVEERREEKTVAPSAVPPIPSRALVNAGGGGSGGSVVTTTTSSSSSSSSGGASGGMGGKKHAVVDDKEARELKELEAMMGM